jgi:hypothetical protein
MREPHESLAPRSFTVNVKPTLHEVGARAAGQGPVCAARGRRGQAQSEGGWWAPQRRRRRRLTLAPPPHPAQDAPTSDKLLIEDNIKLK